MFGVIAIGVVCSYMLYWYLLIRHVQKHWEIEEKEKEERMKLSKEVREKQKVGDYLNKVIN